MFYAIISTIKITKYNYKIRLMLKPIYATEYLKTGSIKKTISLTYKNFTKYYIFIAQLNVLIKSS